MFGALIRAAERWRGLRFTKFELRQLAMLRKELDEECQASIMSPARSSQPRCFQQIQALTLRYSHDEGTSREKIGNSQLGTCVYLTGRDDCLRFNHSAAG